MKKRYIFISLVLMGFLFMLAGCGSSSIGGAPGSSGSDDTGIHITSVNLTALGDMGSDFDTYAHPTRCDGEPEPALTKEQVTMTVGATLVNSGFDTFPANVTECTITYLKADENPAAPIIEKLNVYPNCTIIDGTVDCVVDVIDVQRKWDFWDDITFGLNETAEVATHYVAFYKCEYQNIYGESGHFEGRLSIRLWDFITC